MVLYLKVSTSFKVPIWVKVSAMAMHMGTKDAELPIKKVNTIPTAARKMKSGRGISIRSFFNPILKDTPLFLNRMMQ